MAGSVLYGHASRRVNPLFSLTPLQGIFEAVNKAYEFLCSKSAKRTEGPDPHRIVLLLQTQSILFKRYADGREC